MKAVLCADLLTIIVINLGDSRAFSSYNLRQWQPLFQGSAVCDVLFVWIP